MAKQGDKQVEAIGRIRNQADQILLLAAGFDNVDLVYSMFQPQSLSKELVSKNSFLT